MNKEERSQLVAEIRAAVREDFPELRIERSCLYTSLYTVLFLKQRGILSCLQAGSTGWRIVPSDLDDGIGITHFSFVWSPHEMASRIAMMSGDLPEMHVWVGIPATQELIDLNTGQLPAFLKHVCPGQEWLAPAPPDYLWINLPDWGGWQDACVYDLNEDATEFAQHAAAVVLKSNISIIRKRFQP